MKPTNPKRKNVQDLTLKNLHAMKKRIGLIEDRLQVHDMAICSLTGWLGGAGVLGSVDMEEMGRILSLKRKGKK